MPKFELEWDDDLREYFELLGLRAIFKSGEDNFTNLTTSKYSLQVSHVLHKARVTVDEKGTEALAATVFTVPAVTSVGPL
jgi:serpin B